MDDKGKIIRNRQGGRAGVLQTTMGGSHLDFCIGGRRPELPPWLFSSSGTGCGIRGIAWAGLHDDAPEKGLTLSASCRGRTVSCPAHPCGGRKFFQIIPWEERRSGAQALDPRPRFQIRFRHFFARWSKVPMDLGMPMCSRLLIHAYGTSVLCRTARAMMSLDGWL